MIIGVGVPGGADVTSAGCVIIGVGVPGGVGVTSAGCVIAGVGISGGASVTSAGCVIVGIGVSGDASVTSADCVIVGIGVSGDASGGTEIPSSEDIIVENDSDDDRVIKSISIASMFTQNPLVIIPIVSNHTNNFFFKFLPPFLL